MQPVTPLRQQQLHTLSHHPGRESGSTASRSRRSTGNSSRRSTRLQGTQQATPNFDSKEGLAAPLSLTRKRQRTQDNDDQQQQQQEGVANHLPDLHDLFANGRALYNATTTSLAAPAEIPSKKPRLTTALAASLRAGGARGTTVDHNTVDGEQDDDIQGTPYTRASARTASASTRPSRQALDALATPQQATRASTRTASGTGSGRQGGSSRKAGSKRAPISLLEDSTGKRSRTTTGTAATKTTAAVAGIDSISRRTRSQERRLQQEQDALEWKKKYKRAFRTFVFYFDGLDVVRKREAETYVKDLGARVESFFSKQVSHVVTVRPIPEKLLAPSSLNLPATTASAATVTTQAKPGIFSLPLQTKESNTLSASFLQMRNSSESPVKQAANGREVLAARKARTRQAAAPVNGHFFPMKTPPKVKGFVDWEKTESHDILVKAQSFGIKIWNLEKLQRVLERLLDSLSPSKPIFRQQGTLDAIAQANAGYSFSLQMNGAAGKPSLPSLLRAEALSGSTYERDLSTIRPDYHYFNPKQGYVLVEDSSGDFQPAHAKEYEMRIPKAGVAETLDTDWPTLWGGQEGRQAFYKTSASYKPSLPSTSMIAANRQGLPSAFKRTMSLDRVPAKAPTTISHLESNVADPGSYLAASGNSQILTSNVQSGTSTRSGQVIGANGVKTGVNSLANGVIVDKRLARLGSKNAHIVTLGRNNSIAAQSALMANELVQTSKGQMKRSVSLDTGLRDLKSLKPPRPEPKKPGYCENCRLRFDDFKAHTRTKKHRRFALDDANWALLDSLFSQIKRPINKDLLELYHQAGCEVPSDIEASDKEEDEDESSDEEMDDDEDEEDDCEEEDSGYATRTSDPERMIMDANGKMRYAHCVRGGGKSCCCRDCLAERDELNLGMCPREAHTQFIAEYDAAFGESSDPEDCHCDECDLRRASLV